MDLICLEPPLRVMSDGDRQPRVLGLPVFFIALLKHGLFPVFRIGHPLHLVVAAP